MATQGEPGEPVYPPPPYDPQFEHNKLAAQRILGLLDSTITAMTRQMSVVLPRHDGSATFEGRIGWMSGQPLHVTLEMQRPANGPIRLHIKARSGNTPLAMHLAGARVVLALPSLSEARHMRAHLESNVCTFEL